MTWTVSPFGRLALMVEVADPAEARAFATAVRRSPARGQVDVVPAEVSVLVTFDVEGRLDAAATHFESLTIEPGESLTGRTVEIPTLYDGEDLASVAEALGLTVAEVIESHTSQTWTAAFTGFAPGFAYLTGESDALTIPRRATPRTSVPAGSVAIADRYSGIYPRASPGGWHLLGRTDAELWNTSRDRPALIEPGDTVRFAPARRLSSAATRRVSKPSKPPQRDHGPLEILTPALQSLIEDAGRPGSLHLGVPRSGAADRTSWADGNTIVGNRPGAASIETVYGGLKVTAHGTLVLAITGASPGALIDDTREVAAYTPFALLPGEHLELLPPEHGLCSYLAIRGGIATQPDLGSRSTDILTGTGGPPLAAGDRLPIGTDIDGAVDATLQRPTFDDGLLVLELTLTPHAALLTDESRGRLTSQVWTVSASSNRVGVRLEGRPLELREAVSLPSAGIVEGAVQLPPSGLPLVFGRDHPGTGGYPVVGVLGARSFDPSSQAGAARSVRLWASDTSPR
jgi:KipI family sensor histidine kinase inhibitor